MADRALPIIFINLSGEMIYVIQQRLEAQNISEDKSRKVIQDIISTMLNDQFIKELFEPQHMYSRSAMQSVFEKLVHSSIMRLNSNSMSKLYDLMLMVFKYQVVNCENPEEILLVTLNHMDAIKNCAKPYPELKEKVENVYSLLISNYKDMSHEDYQCLYKCIEVFLKDLNIRHTNCAKDIMTSKLFTINELIEDKLAGANLSDRKKNVKKLFHLSIKRNGLH
ncbi:Protein OSCP1 [Araneus ventricosus]|uniref:Protein OSCP1 n=1 Tax=Araneus ventricosus TaxID=182803 RepID=A0A4Y2JH92_ARAVE|nr:Protein OSCP1 [Araneus ventricosus]